MDNEQEITRVLAEFMGWHENDGSGRGSFIPRVCHDLNAMHEVEAELEKHGQTANYLHALYFTLPDTENRLDQIDPDMAWEWWEWHAIHATAEQRARAAYSVISQHTSERRAALRKITQLGEELGTND